MRRFATHSLAAWSVAVIAVVMIGTAAPADAAVVTYWTNLNGANEAPPNASPGVGAAQVDIDVVAHTMRVQASFAGLLGNTTACHIHAPTAVAGTGTAGVATMTPSFTGFPLGVTAGAMDQTFDLTLAASFNAPFVTANGGTAAGAEAALALFMSQGRAYFNVHTSVVGGGEIRGFLTLLDPTSTTISSWGKIKNLYR